MKQQRRDHRRSCGQVLGFLRHYRPLSHGVPEQSAEAVCTDDCLKSLQDSKAVGRQGRERWQARNAAALLRRQDALQAEVSTVVTELDLMARRALAGTATLIGSAALGLLVWRALDICVVSPGLPITQALAIMQPMVSHPQGYQIRYANKSGVFNDTRQTKDSRSFFVLQ